MLSIKPMAVAVLILKIEQCIGRGYVVVTSTLRQYVRGLGEAGHKYAHVFTGTYPSA